MSEPKFAPRHWWIEGMADGGFDIRAQANDGETFVVCSRTSWGSLQNMAEMSEANAHLIAAAPELYDALAGIVDVVARCTDNSGNPTYEVCQQDDFSDARAALAKARGEQ